MHARRGLYHLGGGGCSRAALLRYRAGNVVQTEQVRAELVAHAPRGHRARQRGVARPEARAHPALAYLLEERRRLGPAHQLLVDACRRALSAGDIDWPTPRQLPIGPLLNFGYEGTTSAARAGDHHCTVAGRRAARTARGRLAGVQDRMHPAVGLLRTRRAGTGAPTFACRRFHTRAGGAAARRSPASAPKRASMTARSPSRLRGLPAGLRGRARDRVSRDRRRRRQSGAGGTELGWRPLAGTLAVVRATQ